MYSGQMGLTINHTGLQLNYVEEWQIATPQLANTPRRKIETKRDAQFSPFRNFINIFLFLPSSYVVEPIGNFTIK